MSKRKYYHPVAKHANEKEVMELVKDDEFTSFYYDGATYTFEISEVQA